MRILLFSIFSILCLMSAGCQSAAVNVGSDPYGRLKFGMTTKDVRQAIEGKKFILMSIRPGSWEQGNSIELQRMLAMEERTGVTLSKMETIFTQYIATDGVRERHPTGHVVYTLYYDTYGKVVGIFTDRSYQGYGPGTFCTLEEKSGAFRIGRIMNTANSVVTLKLHKDSFTSRPETIDADALIGRTTPADWTYMTLTNGALMDLSPDFGVFRPLTPTEKSEAQTALASAAASAAQKR